jgi:hypothetical protein
VMEYNLYSKVDIFRGLKEPQAGADHSAVSNAKVKTSRATPSFLHMSL